MNLLPVYQMWFIDIVGPKVNVLYHRLYDGIHLSYVTQAHIARVMARMMHSNIIADYDTHSLSYHHCKKYTVFTVNHWQVTCQ